MQSISEKPGVGFISFALISFAAGSISSFISFLIWGLSILNAPNSDLGDLLGMVIIIAALPAAYVAGITTILLSFLFIRSTNKSGSKSVWTNNQVLGSILLSIVFGPASGIGSVLLLMLYLEM